MKKVLALVLIVVTFYSCVGCSSEYKNQDGVVAQEVDYEYVNDAQNYYSECNIADDGYGYYFTAKQMNGYKLFYYDHTLSEAVPLCSKVNCTHTGSDCDAIFSDEECLLGLIWYQHGSLYRMEKDLNTGDVMLISFDRDGSNPKKIGVLWNGDNIRYSVTPYFYRTAIMHQGYLYYCYQLDKSESVQIFRMNIDGGYDKEQIGIVDMTELDKIIEIHMSNSSDKIYFSVWSKLSETTKTEMETDQLTLYQYDITQNIMSQNITERGIYIMQEQVNDGQTYKGGSGWSGTYDILDCAFDNDYMYMYRGFSGEIVKHNLETGEQSIIYQTTGSGNLVYYNNHLYLNNYNVGNKNLYVITQIDPKGNLIQNISTNTAFCYFGDSNFLFYKYDVTSIQYKEYGGNGTNIVYVVYDIQNNEFKKILDVDL